MKNVPTLTIKNNKVFDEYGQQLGVVVTTKMRIDAAPKTAGTHSNVPTGYVTMELVLNRMDLYVNPPQTRKGELTIKGRKLKI